MKNIVIVGGGTAGWLTALYSQKIFPNSKITVIASSEIGILGAGEGTTVDFIRFLKYIDVPVTGIIKYAKGTIKNGIKFTNWNGDGQSYFHPFFDRTYLDDIELYKHEIHEGKNLNEVQYASLSSLNNKVFYKQNTLEKIYGDALHFDAGLLAEYLKSIAIKRNIKLLDDQVLDFILDEYGFITGLKSEAHGIVESDFVFDCSGFKRLIIGNLYKSHWNSYTDFLPSNRAMPFFIPNEGEELPPYTEAIAMKYGWMWKIPVQGRYGCGYVFDSNFANDTEIKKEIEEYVGHEITSLRIFSFDAGCYEKVWIKNCVAIGLSSGFTEPLEATSIWVSIQILQLLKQKIDLNNLKNETTINNFNHAIKHMNDTIVNFLHFHYLTKRQDSEFWRKFTLKNKSPELVKNLIDIANDTLPNQTNIDYLTEIMSSKPKEDFIRTFEIKSWYTIGAGNKMFKANFQKPIVDTVQYKKNLLSKLDELISHNDYLEMLKNAS